MNEEPELSRIFTALKSEISASDSLRRTVEGMQSTRKRSRRFPMRLSLVGGVVVGVTIAGALFVTSSKASAAGLFGRMQSAIKDAKYMHLKSYSKSPGKSSHLFGETYYLNGAWRTASFPGTPLSRVFIRVGNDQWNYQEATDVSVQEPYAGGYPEGTLTALDFAKDMAEEGMINSAREFHIETRPNFEGRSVYAIVGSRSDTHYHLEMIVDKKTDLPVRSVFSGQSTKDPNYREIIEEFDFSGSVDPDIFSPKVKPTTKVFRAEDEAKRLIYDWDRPLKSISVAGNKVDVRDITLTNTGNLFIACSVGQPAEPNTAGFPRNLVPDSVVDDNGRKYVLVRTLAPGGVFGDTRVRDMLVFGRDRVVFTEWAPFEPMKPWVPSKSTNVHFVARTWLGAPTFYDTAIQTSVRLDLPGPIDKPFPAYSSSMLLDDCHLSFEEYASILRAQSHEKAHEYAAAVRWYRDAARVSILPSQAKAHLRKAERCQKQFDIQPPSP